MPNRSLTAIAQMCSDCNGKGFPQGMPAMEEDTIKVRYGLVASAGSKCAIQ
jgi:hypothetical protein